MPESKYPSLSESGGYRYNVGRRRKVLNNVAKNTKTIFR